MRLFIVTSFLCAVLAVAACDDDADDGDHPTCQDATCLDRPPRLNPRAQCTLSKECNDADAGVGGVCREGQCVTITSPACTRIYGNWLDPGVILLGLVDPLSNKSPTADPFVSERRAATELAMYEWASVRLTKEGKPRPYALIECDDEGIPSRTREAIRHLSTVVNAPGIIVANDDELATLHESITDRRIAVVCSGCIASSPSDLSDILVRRVLPRLDQEVPLANEVIKLLETKIRTTNPTLPPSAAVRVAIVAIDTAASRTYAQKLEALSVSKSITTQTIFFNANDEASRASATEQVVNQLQPHIIILSAGADIPAIGSAIEAKWPSNGTARPYYVPNALALRAGGAALFSPWATATEDTRKRVVGVGPELSDLSRANYDRFQFFFQLRTSKLPTEGSETYVGYDAFHSLGYAIVAALQNPTLDGTSIATSFSRLTAGIGVGAGGERHAINVGVDGLGIGPAVVAGGGSIDLIGVGNGLDWDLPTGDIHTNSSTWCLTTAPHRLERAGGLTWSYLGQKVGGALSCP